MITFYTKLFINDNSGGKIAKCIKIIGTSNKKYAKIGDIITVTIKKSDKNKKIQQGDIKKGIIIQTKKNEKHYSGFYIKNEVNSVILINEQKNPIGTRIFGPLHLTLRKKKLIKLISLAKHII
jgi:large subunit ribosomal protein L14